MKTIRVLARFVAALNVLPLLLYIFGLSIGIGGYLIFYFTLTAIPLIIIITALLILFNRKAYDKKEIRKTIDEVIYLILFVVFMVFVYFVISEHLR